MQCGLSSLFFSLLLCACSKHLCKQIHVLETSCDRTSTRALTNKEGKSVYINDWGEKKKSTPARENEKSIQKDSISQSFFPLSFSFLSRVSRCVMILFFCKRWALLSSLVATTWIWEGKGRKICVFLKLDRRINFYFFSLLFATSQSLDSRK